MARLPGPLRRGIDIAVGFAGGAILAPIALLIALAISLDSPGPVILREPRVGRGGRLFPLLRFRTIRIYEPEGVDTWQRRTRIGVWLRRFGLAYLPTLANLLAGDLTLVGPPPPRPGDVAAVATWYRGRQHITPGLTGLLRDQPGTTIRIWPE